MRTFFTADTHFGHDNIRRLAKRPFETLEQMDEVLIARWNTAVGPQDIVWHIGDFAYRGAMSAEAYRARLNGEIHLVAGNHDVKVRKGAPGIFASIHDIAEVKIAKDRTVVLCHYPMREWPGAWHGTWHLFGHVHGRLDKEPHGYSMDVGVDTNDFRPYAIEDITQRLTNRDNPFDNAGRDTPSANGGGT